MDDAMSDVERLRERFIAEFDAGRAPDPGEYLAQVEGTDRRELEALLDAYLEQAPRCRFDAAAFAASPARALTDDLAQALEGRAGTWPVFLPRLRHAARLRRAELVRRLAAALGVAGREAKVERYYHEMEQGLLEPRGVSDHVLDALSELLGTTRERLQEAAEALGPAAPSAGDALFTRTATPDADARAAMGVPPAPAAAPPESEAFDEVDELFRGG
jgi:hypothetical protein